MPAEARIDTHQHLLYPDRFAYRWAHDLFAVHGPFHTESYAEAARGCGIIGTVFVEVDVDVSDQVGEAKFFAELAEDPSLGILGIVASGRPEHDGFQQYVDAISHPNLKGIRRLLQGQPDELFRNPRLRENIAWLAERDLSFDLCVKQPQLPSAFELVRACPTTTFVLDHFGNPDVAAQDSADSPGFAEWQTGIRALADQENVTCKLSGLTTVARPEQRNPESFQPYFDAVIDAFGTDRCIWGGDWPVCNLGGGLTQWSELTDACLASRDATARRSILVDNATRIYRLDPSV